MITISLADQSWRFTVFALERRRYLLSRRQSKALHTGSGLMLPRLFKLCGTQRITVRLATGVTEDGYYGANFEPVLSHSVDMIKICETHRLWVGLEGLRSNAGTHIEVTGWSGWQIAASEMRKSSKSNTDMYIDNNDEDDGSQNEHEDEDEDEDEEEEEEEDAY